MGNESYNFYDFDMKWKKMSLPVLGIRYVWQYNKAESFWLELATNTNERNLLITSIQTNNVSSTSC